MPTPSSRAKFQIARGTNANLQADKAALREGELCYARDVNILYIKEGTDLIPLSFTESSELASYIREITGIDQSGEPMGHSDKTESIISFNSGTRTFSIAPVSASFTVWCKGIKNIFLETESIQIPNATGLYYIYFDENGSLGYQLDYFDWESQAPTAYVYWNSTTQELVYFGDERHGITLDWQTHEYLHRTRGAALANGFDASAYTLTGTGNTDADAQFSLAGGTFFDEDLQVDVIHSATPVANTWQQFITGPCKPAILYRSGSSWRIDIPTNFALKSGTAHPVYNQSVAGSWVVTDSGINKYIVSYIIASNNLTYPVLAVIGQAQYNNIGDAEITEFNELDLTGFPSREFRPLYKLIFQVGNYANTIKARLRGLQDLRYISAGSPVPSTLSSEQVQDYAAQLFLNGTHSGLNYVYDDDNNAINSTASVLSVNSKTGAVSLKMQEASDASLTTTDVSQGSWTATGTSDPPAITLFSQSGNTLIFHSTPTDISGELSPGDTVLLNTIVATVESTTSVPASDYWTLTVSGVTLPTYLAGETLQLLKRITNELADKDTWIYNSTSEKWEPIPSLQESDIQTIASNLFVHGHHTGIAFVYDEENDHIDATVDASSSIIRNNVSVSALVASGSTTTGTVTLPKSCIIYKITLNKPSWFRLYNSTASKDSDASRLETVDPTAASGVICEIIATSSSSYTLTPTPIAMNAESPASTVYPFRITNNDTTANIEITIEYLSLES